MAQAKITPRVIRGSLMFQVAEVLFPSFAMAACAWSAADAHRLDIIEPTTRLIDSASYNRAGDAQTSTLPDAAPRRRSTDQLSERGAS